jgi:hypothetical protein
MTDGQSYRGRREAAVAGSEEIVVGMVGFLVDPPRDPRPPVLTEEELLFKRLRTAVADPLPAGLAPERFPDRWRASRRDEVA